MDDPTFITTEAAINTSFNFPRYNNYYFRTTSSSILELVISNSDFATLFVIAKILLSILYFSLTSDLTNSANAKFIKKKQRKIVPKNFFII